METPYLTPGRVRAALRSLDLRPTRSMGQNFLVDPPTLDTIVAAAELTPDDTVVEVGPGLGVLTWELLRHAGRVVAVELDRRLAARLHEEFAGTRNLEIVQGDILNLAPEQLLADDRPPTTDDRPKTNDEDKETRRQGETVDTNLLVSVSPGLRVSQSLGLPVWPAYKVVANLP